MTFKQLVTRNILRNTRDYGTYFLSSVCSSAIFFIFSLLFFHPNLSEELQGSSDTIGAFANVGMLLAEIVVVLMSFVFLWYAFSLFLQKRKPQLAVYLTLGMSRKQLKHMLYLENLLLGLVAILTGILTGLLSSKLILLITQNVLNLDKTLKFYFPWQSILLTFVIYAVLFLLLSMFTLTKLNRQSLDVLKKSAETSSKPPKTSFVKSVLSVVFILVGYALAQVAAMSMMSRFDFFIALGLLLACVLITILGTYLFFQQASVWIFKVLKKQDRFLNHGRLLTISNLMFRMKSNATMYFLISIIASIAFVGIGVSKSIGSDRFAQTQGDSFAYVYNYSMPITEKKQDNTQFEAYHQKNLDYLMTELTDAGFEPQKLELKTADIGLELGGGKEEYYSAISLSDYQRIAKILGKEELRVTDDSQAIQLAQTNSQVSTAKNKTSKVTGKIINQKMKLTVSKSDIQTTIGFFSPLVVVTDETFNKIYANLDYEQQPVNLIHFENWQKSGEVNAKVMKHLEKENEKTRKKEEEYLKSIDNENYEREFTDDEVKVVNQIESQRFFMTSLYQTWHLSRQANGMIMLISVLLGTVFFIFSSSIIYFKLFGDLEVDGKYHRSLHITGVSRKHRHKMVTTEIIVMFFAPFVMSSLHFIAAMTAMKFLIDLPVYKYVLVILSVYLILQLIFFFVSRFNYLRQLDRYANPYREGSSFK
ncbi:FtsX-like permease family protein [Vagococcus silagei]|uniref:FtsX-like permease family protein n=1 Tax=Vagococcus silagei TaxID=2508885 RepID=A0A4S3B6S6_9ENTE|nr:FtsX-like permease family protein [Vagococcus silagei]THB62117.1 FtsX-like permease family protein [Vagococcus silagei]